MNDAGFFCGGRGEGEVILVDLKEQGCNPAPTVGGLYPCSNRHRNSVNSRIGQAMFLGMMLCY